MAPEPAAPSVQVDLQPIGRRVRVPAGSSLLEAAQKAAVDLAASCGAAGFCGTCLVRVIKGQVNPLTEVEADTLDSDQRAAGLRLACQTLALGDVRLHIPQESLGGRQQLQVEGPERGALLCPAVTAVKLELPALLSRINEILAERGVPELAATPDQIDQLCEALPAHMRRARLVVRFSGSRSELVTVLPTGAPILGLALDIGSTKIALYLVHLESGGTLASSGVMNPQIAYGEDVVSRIAYANHGEEQRRLLQSVLADGINAAVTELCVQAGISPRHICDCTAVGNTVIHHLFCGLPVAQLGQAPYLPAVKDALMIPARQLGLAFAPGAQVYLPPILAGYVGADHVAALAAGLPLRSQASSILIDIGTNTEISLLYQGNIYSCSCASGPAFEGAHIHDGMRAVPGVIERVEIAPGGSAVRVHTIQTRPPIGICGSGILSAAAELYRAGVVDHRGALRWNGQKEFVLAPAAHTGHGRDILVTRADIHEIQLAKGAIRAGIEVLLRRAGIEAAAVQDWIIAGAFGTHIDLRAAMAVGMFPSLPLEHFHQVGNAAGVGAKLMLLSTAERARAEALLAQIEYVELTTEPGFQDIYLQALYFPEG